MLGAGLVVPRLANSVTASQGCIYGASTVAGLADGLSGVFAPVRRSGEVFGRMWERVASRLMFVPRSIA